MESSRSLPVDGQHANSPVELIDKPAMIDAAKEFANEHLADDSANQNDASGMVRRLLTTP
jgi:hypothetical protein